VSRLFVYDERLIYAQIRVAAYLLDELNNISVLWFGYESYDDARVFMFSRKKELSSLFGVHTRPMMFV